MDNDLGVFSPAQTFDAVRVLVRAGFQGAEPGACWWSSPRVAVPGCHVFGRRSLAAKNRALDQARNHRDDVQSDLRLLPEVVLTLCNNMPFELFIKEFLKAI